MSKLVRQYIKELNDEFKTGKTKESSFRHALKELVQGIKEVFVINEGKSGKKGLMPDFIVKKDHIDIGIIETKDIGESLDQVEKSEQIKKYLDSFDNFILTNYLEFRFFHKKYKKETVNIANTNGGNISGIKENYHKLYECLEHFLTNNGEKINTPEELAIIMANKAKLLKRNILKLLNEKKDDTNRKNIYKRYSDFERVLIDNLKFEEFTDICSQTIIYGMFVAWANSKESYNFSRKDLIDLIPKSNPFLRDFFHYISYDLEDEISWIVDSLIGIFNLSEVNIIFNEFKKKEKDPIIYFYEDFLEHYDKDSKKNKGVFYTDKSIVKYIVRGIDEILRNEFDIGNGLSADTKIEGKDEYKVQLLDPALGTGSFLNETIKYVYKEYFEGKNFNLRKNYIDEVLRERMYGFEILMAPYSIAHYRLLKTLEETGYENINNERFHLYLTNSLDYTNKKLDYLVNEQLSKEAEKAKEIKNKKAIMVVMGNPPYNAGSTEKNKTEWINNLIKDYKEGITEKNIKNINDDYIKFIKFSQYHIDKKGYGIVAMITNNSYLTGVTHRRMRKSLLESFDKLFIINLHGNSNIKEKSPDGSKDENVFNIKVGTSIIFGVKEGNNQDKLADVYYADSYGSKENKYIFLENTCLYDTKFEKLELIPNRYFFDNRSFNKEDVKVYDEGFGINEIFNKYSSGIETQNDSINIQYNHKKIKKVKDNFIDLGIKDLKDIYNNENIKKIKNAKQDIDNNGGKIIDINYRPFDIRKTIYTGKSSGLMGRPRHEISKHFFKNNIGLVTTRQQKNVGFFHVFIVNTFVERGNLSNKTSESSFMFPLYLYQDEHQKQKTLNFKIPYKIPNLNFKYVAEFNKILGLEFISDGKGDLNNEFGPEDILDYIYAVLHSPSYREKYKEFLQIDYPRVPYPKDKKSFSQLVELGEKLKELHLMKINTNSTDFEKIRYCGEGNDKIEKVEFIPKEENKNFGKVYINKTQYFDNVSDIAWNFWIGGYQPAQKWLKDRKKDGIVLGYEDIQHYKKIIYILNQTHKIMNDIDEIYFISENKERIKELTSSQLKTILKDYREWIAFKENKQLQEIFSDNAIEFFIKSRKPKKKSLLKESGFPEQIVEKYGEDIIEISS